MSQILKKKINKDIIISFLKDFCQNEKKKNIFFHLFLLKKQNIKKKLLN
jgi:hypothetical protein